MIHLSQSNFQFYFTLFPNPLLNTCSCRQKKEEQNDGKVDKMKGPEKQMENKDFLPWNDMFYGHLFLFPRFVLRASIEFRI